MWFLNNHDLRHLVPLWLIVGLRDRAGDRSGSRALDPSELVESRPTEGQDNPCRLSTGYMSVVYLWIACSKGLLQRRFARLALHKSY